MIVRESSNNLMAAMAAATTTLLDYTCSVCNKSFGDNHARCAQHVTARLGSCKAKGATVLSAPIHFGRHDRNVGGRFGERLAIDPVDGERLERLSASEIGSDMPVPESPEHPSRSEPGKSP
jgi:hypothetical protein